MSKIYFIRHGQSRANADEILAGGQDSPLTDLGRQQAEDVADVILEQGIEFDTIITSSQIRATETARIISHKIGYPEDVIVVIDDLREKSSGSFEGRPRKYVIGATEDEMKQAGGETLTEFAVRVERSQQQVAELAQGTTLVVGHSVWYRMAQCNRDSCPPITVHDYEHPDNGKLLDYPI